MAAKCVIMKAKHEPGQGPQDERCNSVQLWGGHEPHLQSGRGDAQRHCGNYQYVQRRRCTARLPRATTRRRLLARRRCSTSHLHLSAASSGICRKDHSTARTMVRIINGAQLYWQT
ncbi:hypothetical protein PsYK624_149850 [Phanerochaete sordida]|uniref:Uncharacterized protein n=1 Tax=Phanerochaete sordida TaxID=48140 RepID=A0A9P3GSR3_9APHY|nr:hypothetical protein PsYK624_149850 [Phanerochaete sordida]